MMMVRTGIVLIAAVAAQGVEPLRAQAVSVSGQVSILERPGETTEDLGNVVVFLEPVSAAARVRNPASNVTKSVITLDKRQFAPRVAVVPEGSTVEFPNKDPFSHNVFSKTKGGFDTGVYGRGKSREQTFHESGVYPLYCNVHPRMTAFVVTLATSHFTQAGGDGRFTIGAVPAGDYVLHAWHDRATEHTQRVTVKAAAVGGLRIELDARGYKYVQHKNKVGKDYTSATGDRY
jgi:plastocyanin